MEVIEALPEVKIPATTGDSVEKEYAARIAHWKEEALNATGKTVYGLRQAAKAVQLLQCERDILASLRTIGEQFLVIGQNLMRIRDDCLCYSVPLSDDSWLQAWSFEEYVERKFGFKKSTAYALIGVYSEFGTTTCHLKSEYTGFGYSQLVEMLPMSPGERVKVTAGMTVKEIREMRKVAALKMSAAAPNPIDPVIVAPVEIETVEILEPEKSEQSDEFRTSGNGSAEPQVTYFKNDTERKAFLEKYTTWPLWLQIPALQLDVHRVQLTDGATILAIEYTERAIEGECAEHRYRAFLLFKPGEDICLDFHTTAPTYIVQYLSGQKAGVYWVDA